jgi:hypothetical protein
MLEKRTVVTALLFMHIRVLGRSGPKRVESWRGMMAYIRDTRWIRIVKSTSLGKLKSSLRTLEISQQKKQENYSNSSTGHKTWIEKFVQ